MNKFRFVAILVTVVTSVCFAGPTPKWTVQESWQKKIRNGLTERAVVRILGKPKYISRGGRSTYYWYQEKAIRFKRTGDGTAKKRRSVILTRDTDAGGIVTFQHKTKKTAMKMEKYAITKPRMLVSGWEEPDFARCQNVTIAIPVKLKPKGKLEKWQKENSWSKMAINMSINAVARILGPPQSEKGSKFYYGDLVNYGDLTFSSGRLISWREPFWLDIKARLYEPVEKKTVLSEFIFLREWKPDDVRNGFGADVLLQKDFTEQRLVAFVKQLAGKHDPVIIRVWTSRIAWQDENAKTPEFKSDYILIYLKNLTGTGAYHGFNEIRWMQEVGKYSHKFGKTTKF